MKGREGYTERQGLGRCNPELEITVGILFSSVSSGTITYFPSNLHTDSTYYLKFSRNKSHIICPIL
jgi:hypothetical protein